MKLLTHQLMQELFRARIARGWSQAELAQKAGFSETFLSQLQQEKKPLTLRTLAALTAALNVDLELKAILR